MKLKQTIQANKAKSYFIQTVSLAYVFLFCYTATSKWVDFSKFLNQLQQSPLLTNYALLFAYSVPALEIILSILIIFEVFRFWGLYFSYCLMVAFTAYIVVITQLSEFVPCSCGGVIERMSWNEHLIFNISFIIAGAVAIILIKHKTEKTSLQ